MSDGSGLSTTQTQLLQKAKEMREQQISPPIASSSSSQQSQILTDNSTIYSPDKPPIPPRGLPPPLPQRQIISNDSVQLRNRNGKFQ